MNSHRAMLTLVVLALVAAACNGGAGMNPATTTTAPSPTTTQLAPPLETLSDGEHFVFARRGAAGALMVDPAQFLTGDEANAAAREDGVIGANEETPGGFYIRNSEPHEVAVPPAAGVLFVLLGFDADGAPTVERSVSYEDLTELLAGDADVEEYYGLLPGDLPMMLTVDGGEVVSGRQQYLP